MVETLISYTSPIPAPSQKNTFRKTNYQQHTSTNWTHFLTRTN